MHRQLRLCVIAFGTFLVSMPASGGLVSIDNEFGLDAGTVDTTQALEFLDLNLTTDITYRDMQLMMDSGGTMQSWRHASRDEIITMLHTAGSKVPFEPGRYIVPSTPIIHVINLLGITRVIPDFGFGIGGLTGDDNTRGGHYIINMDVFGNQDFADVQNFQTETQTWHSELSGHWLVRANTIPVPASLAMLGLGSIFSIRRQR